MIKFVLPQGTGDGAPVRSGMPSPKERLSSRSKWGRGIIVDPFVPARNGEKISAFHETASGNEEGSPRTACGGAGLKCLPAAGFLLKEARGKRQLPAGGRRTGATACPAGMTSGKTPSRARFIGARGSFRGGCDAVSNRERRECDEINADPEPILSPWR